MIDYILQYTVIYVQYTVYSALSARMTKTTNFDAGAACASAVRQAERQSFPLCSFCNIKLIHSLSSVMRSSWIYNKKLPCVFYARLYLSVLNRR